MNLNPVKNYLKQHHFDVCYSIDCYIRGKTRVYTVTFEDSSYFAFSSMSSLFDFINTNLNPLSNETFSVD